LTQVSIRPSAGRTSTPRATASGHRQRACFYSSLAGRTSTPLLVFLRELILCFYSSLSGTYVDTGMIVSDGEATVTVVSIRPSAGRTSTHGCPCGPPGPSRFYSSLSGTYVATMECIELTPIGQTFLFVPQRDVRRNDNNIHAVTARRFYSSLSGTYVATPSASSSSGSSEPFLFVPQRDVRRNTKEPSWPARPARRFYSSLSGTYVATLRSNPAREKVSICVSIRPSAGRTSQRWLVSRLVVRASVVSIRPSAGRTSQPMATLGAARRCPFLFVPQRDVRRNDMLQAIANAVQVSIRPSAGRTSQPERTRP